VTELDFLPISKEDMVRRGWYYYDFLLINGDAYVDHPSFGGAVISRVLEKAGYRVAVLCQPDWHTTDDLTAMGRPRYGVLITSGNVDSMVAHYSVAGHRRKVDDYTPGGKPGKRPDRAVIVYSNLARRAFPGLPVVIGGIEASLRRFAHYDYWDNSVRRSILEDSGASILVFGMGERAIIETAAALKKKTVPKNVKGTCFMAESVEECPFPDGIELPSFRDVRDSKELYAKSALIQQQEHDAVRGRPLFQKCEKKYLIQNPPQPVLTRKELDDVFDLPYTRRYHPTYEALGGVKAIEEVKNSIIHNRGCFGACNFCALSLHQGRIVVSRSHESVLKEAKRITEDPDFKGYINDVGGPTANFRGPACAKQLKSGACKDRQCLFPRPCPNLNADESDYVALLDKVRALPGVKKVFIRSGIRYDYMLADKKKNFFEALVKRHVSGQLKVAPEHIAPNVLHHMGKPGSEVFDEFCRRYEDYCSRFGLDQYIIPYLMSSHPGSTLEDALQLALYMKKKKLSPKQVQDFYPTPGTISTAMYYTGLDPRDMSPVYVARSPEDKAMQRALLQYRDPKNRSLVAKAIKKAGFGEELLRK